MIATNIVVMLIEIINAATNIGGNANYNNATNGYDANAAAHNN